MNVHEYGPQFDDYPEYLDPLGRFKEYNTADYAGWVLFNAALFVIMTIVF